MLQPAASYAEAVDRFAWAVPRQYNIAADVLRHDGPAILHVETDGSLRTISFAGLRADSARLANLLIHGGLARGDRVGVLLAQSPETAVAHLAAYRAGLIAVPLFTLFGEDALLFRLGDSGARAVVTDAVGWAKIAPLRDRLPALELIVVVGLGADDGAVLDYGRALERASDDHGMVDTTADDPAVIIYTSGTTGNPKGALHAHRVLLGHLPGVEFPHELFPRPGDRFWTPADWAWIGGLFDVLLPALHHGVPVVSHRMAKFDPDRAFDLIGRQGVRNIFLPPTAAKLMRQAGARQATTVRTVASGGETLGAELLDWGRRTFGATINEFYGQTECNLVVGNCAGLLPVVPGSMGVAIPGHRVGVVDAAGNELPTGDTGLLAIRRPDPVMFLGYWNNEAATAAKFAGNWLLTGDQGRRDADGRFWFLGRDDDVITSAGYRIGPGEIEDCLMKHPAVAMAAAVGVPDPLRTEIVKAFVVPRPGVVAGDDLAKELQEFVKSRLAAHEYPRLVAFVDDLPLTATGKIIRRQLRAQG